MDKARKAALSVLDSVFIDESYSNIALDKVFGKFDLRPIDRGFVSAVVYGVLDRKITLDHILSNYLKKGTAKTPVTVMNALRMALYQIMYMDKVPDSAAVNESVNLIKASKFKYSASLVNGVLRNVLRDGITLPSGEDTSSLSVIYSCPEHIIKELISDYGTETAIEFLKESLLTPPVFLRVNLLKTTEDELITRLSSEGIIAEKCGFPAALKVVGGIDVKGSACYKDGLFHTEDLSCQRAVSVLGAKPGERILDMCSAPGGKAFSMAEDMENKGEIIACDIYSSRTELIEKGARRLGTDIVKPTVCDSCEPADLGVFNAILCDVPCSGYGVIRRKPEIKYKPQNDFSELESIQLKIISNADRYLKPGGRLLYSTCTLRKAENSGTVSRFLKNHPQYKLKFEHTFMPQTDCSDGFYCALLEKGR